MKKFKLRINDQLFDESLSLDKLVQRSESLRTKYERVEIFGKSGNMIYQWINGKKTKA